MGNGSESVFVRRCVWCLVVAVGVIGGAACGGGESSEATSEAPVAEITDPADDGAPVDDATAVDDTAPVDDAASVDGGDTVDDAAPDDGGESGSSEPLTLIGAVSGDAGGPMTIDPDDPLGPWGWFTIDAVVSAAQIGSVTADQGEQLIVVDYHLVVASAPLAVPTPLNAAAFRLTSADGTTFEPSPRPPGTILRNGTVVNDRLVFTVDADLRAVTVDVGAHPDDVDGYRFVADIALEPGAAPQPAVGQGAAGPAEVALRSPATIFDPQESPTEKPVELEVVSASATNKIGPDGATPGFRFVIVDVRATRVGGTRTPQVNITESEFRLGAGGEWYGPRDRVIVSLFRDDSAEIGLVFEVPFEANDLVLEAGPPGRWEGERGRTVLYEITTPEGPGE
ncbi:MAG: hypothetical protein AAGD35_17620 [Actinomycetota bacterium]